MLENNLEHSSIFQDVFFRDDGNYVDCYHEFKGLVNVGNPYSSPLGINEAMNDYIQQIANLQRRQPIFMYPGSKEPRMSNAAFDPSQQARSSRSRGDLLGTMNDVMLHHHQKPTVKPKKPSQEEVGLIPVLFRQSYPPTRAT